MWGALTTRVSKAVDTLKPPGAGSGSGGEAGALSGSDGSVRTSDADHDEDKDRRGNGTSIGSSNTGGGSTGSGGGARGGGWGLLSSLAGALSEGLSEDSYTPALAEQHRLEARAVNTQVQVQAHAQAANVGQADLPPAGSTQQQQQVPPSADVTAAAAAAAAAAASTSTSGTSKDLAAARKQLAEQRRSHLQKEREHADEVGALRQEITTLTREHGTREAAWRAEMAEVRASTARQVQELRVQHTAAMEAFVQETTAASISAMAAAVNSNSSHTHPPLASNEVAGTGLSSDVTGEAGVISADAKGSTSGSPSVGSSTTEQMQLQQELASLQLQLAEKTATLAKAKRGIVQLKADAQARSQEAESAQSALKESQAACAALQESLTSKAEVLAERERALHAASTQLAQAQELQEAYGELEAQLQQERQRADELEAIAAAASAAVSAAAATAASDTAGGNRDREEVILLREKLAEQAQRLLAFETEGQTLAKKQSEMEKLVRQTKATSKTLEKDLSEARANGSAQEAVISDLRTSLAQQDSSASTASKSMQAMHAASKAAADRLQHLQSELDERTRELAVAQEALQGAVAEKQAAQQRLLETTQESERMKRTLDDTQNEALERDELCKSVESREGLLRATNAQLQESLSRHMAESSAREERIRDELHDMRRRWQDALSSREGMAAEVAGASAPLLRQLSQLQETLRTRSETWQTAEMVLSERALRAESAREVAEHKFATASEAAQVAQLQLQAARSKLEAAVLDSRDLRVEQQRLVSSERAAQAASREALAAAALEAAQLKGLQQSLKELERHHAAALANSEAEHARQVAALSSELEEARRAVQAASASVSAAAFTSTDMLEGRSQEPSGAGAGVFQARTPARPLAISTTGITDGSSSSGNRGSSEESSAADLPSDPKLASPSASAAAGVGGMSNAAAATGTFAAQLRSNQALRHKADEMAALGSQVGQLERARRALLEEVTALSARNAQLEDECAGVPALQDALRHARHRADVLLQLVGEKEEEVEAAQADMREVKALYRGQMDALLEVSLGRQTGMAA